MFIAITLLLLLITALGLLVARVARPGFGFAWPVAAMGALLAWLSTFLWLIHIPDTLSLGAWLPNSIFNYSPGLAADKLNFPYALGMTSLVMAVILTSAARTANTSPLAWSASLVMAFLGLLAVTSANPLTLVLAWTAMDLIQLIGLLSISNKPAQSESIVATFTVQLAGSIAVLVASVVSFSLGQPLVFPSTASTVSMILLIGTILRVGAQGLPIPYTPEVTLRRGFGSMLRLASIASSLALLARISTQDISVWFLILAAVGVAVVGLTAILRWLRAPDELTGRPQWMLAISMLAFASFMLGSNLGSVAWGSALLFTGGTLFLFSKRAKWLRLLLLVGVFSLSALPFSLTATSWQTGLGFSWLPLIILIPLQALVMTGYARSIWLPGEERLEDEARWVQVFYPFGLLALPLCSLLLGFFGWNGALQVGAWIIGILATLLATVFILIFLRIPVPETSKVGAVIERPRAGVTRILTSLVSALYRLVGRGMVILSDTLEGDGGFLWTILILVLFISIIQGYFR